MNLRTAAWLVGLSGLALLAACGSEPNVETFRDPMSTSPAQPVSNHAADQRPAIDRAVPAKFETATFALG